MSTDLTQFTYNSQELNVIILNGDPWFIAADVCRILEIGNPSQALARLDEDEKSSLIGNGGQKNTGTLNRQIVRPGATTTGVFREYSAAPSITTRSAA